MKYLYYKCYQEPNGNILSKIDGKRFRELAKVNKVETFGHETFGDKYVRDNSEKLLAYRTAA